MARLRFVALAVLALAAAGCGSAPPREGPVPGPAPPGERTVVPATLVLDLADRAEHDRALLREPPAAYESHREGADLVLRARGDDGPREIRLVARGSLSRVGLLDAGRLDAADLSEADLAAAPPGDAGFSLHVFPDFERLVVRFGSRERPETRAALWRAVDRRTLAEVLFPRTGRAVDGCLPGRPGVLAEGEGGVLPDGPLTLLALAGDGAALEAARRIAATWTALGVRARVETLRFPLLRDRLIRGGFDAAVLRVGRPTALAGDVGVSLPPWLCGAAPVAPSEAGLRDTCGLYPLVSLDRVIGARADLTGLRFDDDGRVIWAAVRVPETW